MIRDIPKRPPWWDHPALLLNWKQQDGKWVCRYLLAIPVEYGDIRWGSSRIGGCIKLKISHTTVQTEKPEFPFEQGDIYTPFRDGVHAMRDSVKLRVPVYVICRRKFCGELPGEEINED